jgi:hypothetical protein
MIRGSNSGKGKQVSLLRSFQTLFGIKWLDCEVYQSPPSGAVVKNEWRLMSLSPVPVCFLVCTGDNFAFRNGF